MTVHPRPLPQDFSSLPTPRARLGESPVWSVAESCLWWVDISGCRLLRTRADGATESWATPEEIGAIALTGWGVVVGMETGIFAFSPASGRFERLIAHNVPGVRFNDATTDSAGRLWAGTMDKDNLRAVGEFMRIDPDGSVTVLAEGMGIPNGLAVDEAAGRLYLSDSRADVQTIWCFDLDMASGALGERRVFARMNELPGRPDGGAVDAKGNYWSAGVGGGGAVHVFGRDGTLLHSVPTPMPDPTKIAFGGPDLADIYLTSKGDHETGGHLAVARAAGKGIAPAAFGIDRLAGGNGS